MRPLPLADPGVPDVRSGRRLLAWVALRQRRELGLGVFFGVLWMASQALVPAALGQAIDRGVAGGDRGDLVLWCGALLGLGLVQAASGLLRHRLAVASYLVCNCRVQQLVGRQVAGLGAEATREVTAGDVAALSTTDAHHMGRTLDVVPRLVGAVVSSAAIATILLVASPLLGGVVLVGVPALLFGIGPLVRPLEERERRHRERLGAASALAADTVSGLRVLRGFGGEQAFVDRFRAASQDVRAAAVETARLHSVLEALQVGLPGLFVVGVTWLGARLAIEGTITPGQLVAFYAYSAFLVIPLKTFTEAARKYAAGVVSAGRVVRLLRQRRTIVDPERPVEPPPPGAPLVDTRSGLVVESGALTAVAATEPEDASALVDRLGRYVEDGVRLGPVPIRDLRVDDVRRRVVVVDKDPALLSGTVREALDPPRLGPGIDVERAVEAASAWDVLDGLGGGLDTELPERGRSLSGGQRQRLALARALRADPEILLLDEPTSAVDAHTEARIADGLRAARAGRTTLVTTTSPLLLDRADRVVLLAGGRVVATGTHRELLRDEPAYRDLVIRGEDL